MMGPGENAFSKRPESNFRAVFLIGILICAASSVAQSRSPIADSSRRSGSLLDALSVSTLPHSWVNQRECDGTATVVKRVCHQGDSQCPTGPGDYDTTIAGLQQALTDAELLRVNSDLGTLIEITVGAEFHVTRVRDTIKLRNLGYTGTRCVVIDSSNPLPDGVRVGSTAISSIARRENSTTVVTQSPHGLTTGQVAEIKNVTGWSANFNGTYPVTVLDPLTFSYAQIGPDESGNVTAFVTVVTGPETLTQQVAGHLYRMDSNMIVANVIAADAGAHHYAIYDGEIAATAAKGLSGALVLLGTSPPATSYSENPSHLGVDRMYFHGCAGDVPATIPIWPEPVSCGTEDLGVKMGVRMNCAYCWVMNSFFDQMQLLGLESHVIGTYNGQGPFKVVNNHLRGGATSLHFGNTPPAIPGLIPSDIEVRLNTIDLDPNWYPLSHFCFGGPAKWGLKERLDFESLQRMVFEGNELFQSWCDGDQGALVFMGPTACAASSCTGGNQNLLNDIYFANNLLAHGYHGFAILGRGGLHGLSMPFQRFDVTNNLIWDLGVPGHGSGRVREISVGSYRGETFTCNAGRSGNVSTLTACICDMTNCPSTGISSGDFLLITSCSDISFNTSRAPALSSDPTTLGPITYSNGGPDASGVSCTVSNGQGWPRFFNFSHNTFVANPTSAGVVFLTNETGPVGLYERDFTLVDSISSNSPGTSTTFGWICSGVADGSRSTRSGRCFDTSSLTFHHFIAEGRSGVANYSEYFDGTEAFPPNTLYFPSTNSCYGDYTAECLGYAGDFGTPNPSDYHDFALCQGPGVPSANCTGRSAYAGTASDGQDYGVNLKQLDLARVKLQFSENSFSQ